MSEDSKVHIHEESDRALGNEKATEHIQTNQEETREDNGTVKLYCDPCKTANESADATGFCEECSEVLCKDCINAHKRVTVTRDHTIKEGLENLENGVRIKNERETSNLCPIHTDMELEYFCQTHEELVCSTCNSIFHDKCKNVEHVSVICCRTDFDNETREIEAEMDSLLTNVKNTLYKVKVNLDAVQLNHDEASAYIKKFRREIDDHLDQLESKLQLKIDGLRKDDLNKMKTYGKKCKAIRFEVDSLKNKLKLNTTQNSQFDRFITLKYAHCLICSSKIQLLEIRRSTEVNRYYFKPDKTNQLQDFGDIELDLSRKKTAKFIKAFTIRDRDSETNGRITGMEVVDVNQLVSVDNRNKTMSLTDTMKNILLSRVKFESSPWNVARLSDYTLAVTLPNEMKIVKVEKTKENCLILIKDQAIAVNGKCYGLAARGSQLFVEFYRHIAILNEAGEVLKILNKGYTITSFVVVDYACKYMYLSNSEEGYRRSLPVNLTEVCLENENVSTVDSVKTRNGAITIDRTDTLYYCGNDGIYCFLRDDPQHSNIIPLETASVSSLAYCNKQNVLFVAFERNEIRMYYVV